MEDGNGDDVTIIPYIPANNDTLTCTMNAGDYIVDGVTYSITADVMATIGVEVIPSAVCGNSIVEEGEVCDPPNSMTTESNCVSEGFPFGGNLFCNADCTAFDTTNCDTLETICAQNSGYWDGTDCWMLGLPDNSCDTTCGGAGLSCVAGDWNDDNPNCSVCQALQASAGCDANLSKTSFAPFYDLDNNLCKVRDLKDFADNPIHQDCSATVGPTWRRICNCQ